MEVKEKYRNIAIQSFCLGEILNEREMSQADFVKRLEDIGVKKSKVIISQFVTGKALPSLETLAAFSEVLNIPIWRFLSLDSLEKKEKNSENSAVEYLSEATIECPHCHQKIHIGLKAQK